ncbi:MAG: response regulator [Candidatus Cryptobacteroides sp.]
MRPITLLLPICLFCCVPASALSYAGFENEHKSFHNITFHTDGNKVRDVFQDSSGLVWIATSNGLLSYDGYNTVSYQGWEHENPITEIFDIHPYKGYLAIGTEKGLRFFDTSAKQYCNPFPELQKLPSARYIHNEGDTLYFIGRNERSYCYKDGILEETGYIIYNGTRLSQAELGRIMAIAPSRNGALLLGTDDGLFLYDGKSFTEIDAVEGSSVRCIERDIKGYVLVGTEAGLFIYDENSGRSVKRINDIRDPKSLTNNELNAIVTDAEKNLWICTDFGISISQQNFFYKKVELANLLNEGPGNHFISSLYEEGEIWIGGDNGLLHIKENVVDWFHKDNPQMNIRHNIVRKIYKDRKGRIWIGGDGGVALYDEASNRFNYLKLPCSQPNVYAYDMVEDAFSRLWIASFNGGLYVLDEEAGSVEQLFPGRQFFCLSTYDGLTLWTSDANELISVDVRSRTAASVAPGASNLVACKDDVWFSIAGRLYRYDISIGSVEVLPFCSNSSLIYSLTMDGDSLWFTTMDGLFSLDTGSGTVKACQIRDENYRTASCNPLTRELLLGGKDVFAIVPVSDDSIFQPSSKVRIVQTDGRWDGERRIILTPSGNARFVVSTLSFKPENHSLLYYRINEDKDWVNLGEDNNIITVSNLKGGHYTLYLSSSNPSVNSNADISEYSVEVPYPWYLSLPAFVFYALLLLGFVLLILWRQTRKNREKLARQEREKSLELSNLKTDFFINISHELKTPLSLILAPLERMIEECPSPRQKDALVQIQRNALKLSGLVYKVLDFRQIEDDNTLLRRDIDINALVHSCAESFRPLASDKGVKITFSGQEGPLYARLDNIKMESAISNLLSNAIKYAPERSGEVGICIREEEGTAVVQISDNGPGIGAGDLPFIFVRFYKGKDSAGGSGIGLSLVKKFIELHGGSIEALNSGGTVMTIRLPLEGPNKPEAPGVEQQPDSEEQKPRLLIIDDNAEMLDFLSQSLNSSYECRCAANGEDALKMVLSYSPDLIVVDQMMPQMDGLTFCRNLKKNLLLASVPVIMLTARDDSETELESMKAGVDCFMSKPFELKKLQLRISQLLERKHYFEQKANAQLAMGKAPSAVQQDKSSDEQFLDRITAIVEEHISEEDFNVSSLAQALEMDNKRLYRKLMQLTGISPVNYLRKIRLRRAAQLLEQGGYSVSEVMYMVGYVNASHFTSNFSEEFGMTPGKYLKNNRKMSD